MKEWLQTAWAQLSPPLSAIVLFGAALGAAIFIASKLGVIGKIMVRQRLNTCPQKAAFDQRQAHQDVKIQEVHTQILGLAEDATLAMGGQIAMHCTFAIQRDFFPIYEKEWVQNLMDRYKARGGNHGVDIIFEKAMALPDEPKRARRCTDKEQ
jgi:hypothetical protein